MFDKILIANRGEIACRVIKSCRRLGIETVAVYSDADRDALHVEMADEAVRVGAAPAAESYLQIDRIIEAATSTGAQAIHPGFGFLSEKAEFVGAVEGAGLVFIGPPTGAIAAMGDKIESKRLAAKAGVNTVPGHMGVIADGEEAVKIADDIGYPVMIKASAGGGGKGMRIARSSEEVRDGFRSAQNEARSSFGDDRVFIEKFVEEPRHIEIQVLADSHGNTLYLHERECSIQRRHQKVIEEAPSPFLDPATREAMGKQAVALSEAVDYRSAGTVEFIVDKDRNFYFLEMNTRLQVEHPVTEMITGLDLVEWMIRIAAGEAITFGQDDVKMEGWSVESRVYAEDPLRNFMPSIGRLVHYRQPRESGAVRVDTGVVEGSEISMYYDPMIAKLVTHGESRDEAIARMRDALDAYYIRGINHNIPFLSSVLAHPRFQEGRLTTHFIEEEYPEGFGGNVPDEATVRRLAAVAAFIGHRTQSLGDRTVVRIGERDYAFEVQLETGYLLLRDGDGEMEVISQWHRGEPLFVGQVNAQEITVQVDPRGPACGLTHDGTTVEALVLRPRVAELAALMPFKQPPDMSKYLLSPMPGLLISVAVEEGQGIKAGEELAVVEAMKMENILRAERDGTVAKVHAPAGASLAVDEIIIEFE